MLGMNLARFHKCPDVREKGLCNMPRMVAFASSHSHYSAKKNASLLGIGSDNVIPVDCDENGRMLPKDLERRVNEALKEVKWHDRNILGDAITRLFAYLWHMFVVPKMYKRAKCAVIL